MRAALLLFIDFLLNNILSAVNISLFCGGKYCAHKVYSYPTTYLVLEFAIFQLLKFQFIININVPCGVAVLENQTR